MLRLRSSKVSVQKVVLCPFHCKPRKSGVTLESPVPENIPNFRQIEPKLVKITMRVRRTQLIFHSSSEVGLNFWAQKLESQRSKSFALSISMQTKAIRSYFRVPGSGKYPPFPGKSSQSWSKSRCA